MFQMRFLFLIMKNVNKNQSFRILQVSLDFFGTNVVYSYSKLHLFTGIEITLAISQ